MPKPFLLLTQPLPDGVETRTGRDIGDQFNPVAWKRRRRHGAGWNFGCVARRNRGEQGGVTVRAIFLLLLALAAPAAAQQVTAAVDPDRLGPSFDCRRQSDGLSRLVCADTDLSAVNLAYSQAYLALRHQLGQTADQTLAQEATVAQSALLRQCEVSIHTTVTRLGAEGTRQQVACASAAYQAQREKWLARLTGGALEEARRILPDHVQAQRDLRQLGILPVNVPADGVYRQAMRDAIGEWQRRLSLPVNGLLGQSEFVALRATAMATPIGAQPLGTQPIGGRPPGGQPAFAAPSTPLAAPTPAAQASEPVDGRMRFIPGSAEISTIGVGMRAVLYADGSIIPGSERDLADALAGGGFPPGSVIMLASQGGAVGPGLTMGRLIRKAQLITMVGRQGRDGTPQFDGVNCFSSCTLMFLGGSMRYHAAGARYGVHQFWSEAPMSTATAMAGAQRTNAVLLDYVREMGVDPTYLNEASRAGPNGINVLTAARMLELGILTQAAASSWDLTVASGRRVLRASVANASGSHALALACGDRPGADPLLFVNIRPADPGWLALSVRWPVRVSADGQAMQVGSAELAGPAQVRDQAVVFALRLSPRLLGALTHAQWFTVRRVAPDGVASVGFDVDMAGGRAHVARFLPGCR